MRNDRGQGNEGENQGNRAESPQKTLETGKDAAVDSSGAVAHFVSFHGHACEKVRISRAQRCPGKRSLLTTNGCGTDPMQARLDTGSSDRLSHDEITVTVN